MDKIKNIIDYINNNAIIASLITLAISTIIQIVMKKSDRNYETKKENRKERKQEFLNKKDVEFYYSENVLKKDKYKHLRFYIKNIGNADINQLDICVTAQKNTMLCDIDSIKYIVDSKFIIYTNHIKYQIRNIEYILYQIMQ